MRSRYDFMEESKVVDIDNENYFDPLSVSYNDVQFTKVPPQSQVKDGDITKFWLYMKNNYNIQEMDDILLNINAIPYLGSLRPGDALYLVDINDLENFNTQKLGNAEDY